MSALASLTANYSDSDDEVMALDERKCNNNKMSEANEMPPPPSKLVETQQNIRNSDAADGVPKKNNNTNSNLVSYSADNDVVSDEEASKRADADKEDILPPEPPGRCSKELQNKIARLHDKILKDGTDMNHLIQNRKDFRNPSIYEKLLQFCNINELGTNYPPQLYDPLRWGKESFYEELGRLQKNDFERRQRERKDRTRVSSES